MQLPDALAAFAASSALSVSDIPFNGPISEVRVARVDGKFKINPTMEEKGRADIDLIVAASIENILMVEGEMKEVSEDDMLEALKTAHEAIKVQCKFRSNLPKPQVKLKSVHTVTRQNDEDLKAELWKIFTIRLMLTLQKTANKKLRSEGFSKILDEYLAALPEDSTSLIRISFNNIITTFKRKPRDLVLNESVRLDGRKTNEIRPIWSKLTTCLLPTDLPSFTRGETQSLTTVTLGTKAR